MQPNQEDIVNHTLNSYKERINSFSNNLDTATLLHIIKKSFLLILFYLMLALVGSFLYIRYTQPIYESESVIQINVSNQAKSVLNMYTNYNDGEPLNSEIEILKSPLLIIKTIKELPLEIGYFTKGSVLEHNKYGQNSFKIYNYQIYDSSILGKKIYVKKEANNTYTLTDESFKKIYVSQIKENEYFETNQFGGAILIISEAQFDAEIKNDRVYFCFQSPKQLLGKIQSGLSVKIDDASAKTIRINFKHNNPKLSSDFVNQLIVEYDKFVIAKKSMSSESVLNFIQDQKDTVDKRVKESEQMIQIFQRSNDLKGTSGLSNSYLQQLADMEKEYSHLEVENAILEHLDNAIKNFNEETQIDDIIPVLIGRSFENTLQNLILDLKTKIDKRRDLLSVATLDNKNVKKIDYEINLQISLILKSIRVVYNQKKEKIDAVKNQINMLKSILFTLPEKELELARLNRVMEINNKYYTMLLEKETEYQLSTAGVTTVNQVLFQAEIPSIPISPNKTKVYILATVLWVIVTLLSLFIIYILHDKINSLSDISKLSNASISILGVVPVLKQKMVSSQLIIAQNPKSMISESFRSLRTNLQFISKFEGPKTMGVTSTISGEGKTFIAINLGGIIAYSGKKVIIIDLDMRKPKIHVGFDVPNNKGMSTILIGKDNVLDCIQHSSQQNLDFITAGPIPPNPSELILSDFLQNAIETLKQHYDLIVFDNPPVGLVTDGIPIMQKVDYPLYIFRAEYSLKNFVQNVDRLKNENKINKICVVLNGVDSNRNKLGYGYGYQYADNAGYYSNDFKKKTFWNKIFKIK